jgi:alanine-glyoxylate transaminase/serine-glyoxylate transaminase/serine-pyruvate transaminase
MILGTLGVVEMALGVPHGRGGVQAAIEWLAGEVRA